MANLRTQIRRDAENQWFLIEVVSADTGNQVLGYPTIKLSIPDLQALIAADGYDPLEDGDIEIKFRKFKWRDYESECAEKYAYFLMSQQFAVPVP